MVGVAGAVIAELDTGGCVGNGYCKPFTDGVVGWLLLDNFVAIVSVVVKMGDGVGLLHGDSDCDCGLFIGDTAFSREWI